MRLDNRWSILGLALACLVSVWALSSTGGWSVLAETSPSAADSNPAEEDAADARRLVSPEEPLPFPEEPGRVDLSHEGCHAKVFCSDGSIRECEGGSGESCSTGSESCSGPSCTGTRKFARCATEKVTCPCDCQIICPDPNCPAGNGCISSGECGPCGACFNRRCFCLE